MKKTKPNEKDLPIVKYNKKEDPSVLLKSILDLLPEKKDLKESLEPFDFKPLIGALQDYVNNYDQSLDSARFINYKRDYSSKMFDVVTKKQDDKKESDDPTPNL